ncbi:MAG: hypothetical protein GYA23_00430 [Methanomicrobiales archaeon]|nr:hypothetical protein [Methanomicrobiales archaeon]
MKRYRIPPMLAAIVEATLTSFAGIRFESRQGSCPHCTGMITGYDFKERLFAVILTNGRKEEIRVLVKRFRCRECGLVFSADQPFYPCTRIGSPVVDLCLTLSHQMPYSRVSTCLAEMGVLVDRWSVRNYARQICTPVASAEMFGMEVPVSLVRLAALALASSDNRISELAALEACGYPGNSDRNVSHDSNPSGPENHEV